MSRRSDPTLLAVRSCREAFRPAGAARVPSQTVGRSTPSTHPPRHGSTEALPTIGRTKGSTVLPLRDVNDQHEASGSRQPPEGRTRFGRDHALLAAVARHFDSGRRRAPRTRASGRFGRFTGVEGSRASCCGTRDVGVRSDRDRGSSPPLTAACDERLAVP